jgi:pyridoxamine 5'-phosphate oxidase family protein
LVPNVLQGYSYRCCGNNNNNNSTSPSSSEGFIQPDVVPMVFDFDGEYFSVSGLNLLESTKYKYVQKNPRVALVRG